MAAAIGWRKLTVSSAAAKESATAALAGMLLTATLAGVWLGTTIKFRWIQEKRPPQPRIDLRIPGRSDDFSICVFAAEYTGNLAWFAPTNNIVDASMRTAYLPVYERFAKAPDALAALIAEYEAVGHPLRVIIYVAGSTCL